MSLWQQNYDPAGNIWLSSLIASLPILFFFFALIKLKLKGYLAATYTVAIALLVALFFYKNADRSRAGIRCLRFLLRPVADCVDHHRRSVCL
ncbi:L-lactate permease [Enterobacter cloacae]|uniref:L-lactate permease n=1 Tax=Enterobacter cloacae TaxID=550 RepID=A0A377LR33_ENTCL|nr:L-lactate permease [Enterobacter cloacae]